MPNPALPELKKRIRELTEETTDQVAIFRILAKIASHDAAVRMLAGSFPTATEGSVRQSLVSAASLLRDLAEWATPGVKPAKDDKPIEPPTMADAPQDDVATALAGVDRVKVYTDGASKGNPGRAAVGIVVTSIEGATLFETGLVIGDTTNNIAEYRALITGLKLVLEAGSPKEVYFFSDSELMVKQINGLYKIRNEGLMPLVIEAQSLRRRLAKFQLVYIPREQNRRADELANLALKQARDAARM